MNKDFIKDLIKEILLAIAIAAVILAFIRPTIVAGQSMDDTLHDGNYLILSKITYKLHEPERGDIVVFPCAYGGNGKERFFIKRVIGVEGDVIKTNGKEVYINGKKMDEPYIREGTQGRGELITYHVPENCVFVMGDNRDNSSDSRIEEIGYINKDIIKGKVVFRAFPFNQIGHID